MKTKDQMRRIFDQIAAAGGPAIAARPLAQALCAPLSDVLSALDELEREGTIYCANPCAPHRVYAARR